ncbi:hypothetical protein YOLOSWAG_203 [Erwinia phage vB_EamM_Yoloswag]|uniref:Uncharacterized protein n=1 Tax=Erwinia phage vB_EamM_Yoloswag TaxID=1958956 RepID=A0A1S6L3B3_9CAUD|nr:hypothetical protein HOR66_gp203 [Erwinia phage vB_EamM_Yoloswag]AQT28681.1 hypothetical protein YOLOSWAG_203 [Erwinia phage vB_EamM_Yoloswag]
MSESLQQAVGFLELSLQVNCLLPRPHRHADKSRATSLYADANRRYLCRRLRYNI